MLEVFMDESGDLGFDFRKRGTSKYLVITFLVTNPAEKLTRQIKKIKQHSFSKKEKKVPELKAAHSTDKVRKRILKVVNKLGLRIFAFVVNKPRIKKSLQEAPDKLYNYITGLLMDHLCKTYPSEKINLIVDKVKTKRIAMKDFDSYLLIKQKINGHKNNPMNIFHTSSHNNLALQTVDFVSWAIFRRYNKGDRRFYDIISRNMEREIFWP